MMRARVIGLGQPVAGDDGVGAAVVRALRQRGLPSAVQVLHASDPSTLAALLDSDAPVVIVDAVLGSPAGEVVELAPEDIAARAPARVSSHGFGIAEAIELARALNAGADLPPIRIVAITIARPAVYRSGLSAEVAAAVAQATERVLRLLEVDHV